MNALIAVILGAITVYLTYTRYARRMGQAQQRLTDEQKTAFFFVTLPEALPIAVISRFIGWFQDFGIPVGGVIVNMLLDKAALGQDVPEFVRNRV
ncbi:MAG TPA: ArsA-related P-loop ATPase [Candidatus Acidoferrum sp.]|nr:ArsA-related P-loop ATPase [Candidatus Acidoferrum sp.]